MFTRNKIIPLIVVTVVILFSIVFLSLFIKGAPTAHGLDYQTQYNTQVEGPFEASNSTSRYAITQAIVDNHTFILSKAQARFASPDVSYYKGKFFSLFTPGVSVLAVPFYVIGKMIGLPQIITYLFTDIIAIGNVFLIAYIVKRVSGSFIAGMIGGLCFLFATNALSYSQTFTQHHFTVFVLLLAIIDALSSRSFVSNIILGILYGLAILLDIPNAFLLLPFVLYASYKAIQIKEQQHAISLSIKLSILGLVLGILPIIAFFAYYNYQTTGSYTKIAQLLKRTNYFAVSTQNKPISQPAQKTPKGTLPQIGIKSPLVSRLQLAGVYTLLISKERAWWYYSPIVFVGLLGFYALYMKRLGKLASIFFVTTVVLNIIIYAMFSDPWGGWAFGPRYLIPAAAILAIGIGVAVQKYKKKPFFVFLFFILLIYSIWVNTLGALTTASIPPQIEAEHLVVPIPYTYEYNLRFIAQNKVSSLAYNAFFHSTFTANEYLFILTIGVLLPFLALYFIEFMKKDQTL